MIIILFFISCTKSELLLTGPANKQGDKLTVEDSTNTEKRSYLMKTDTLSINVDPINGPIENSVHGEMEQSISNRFLYTVGNVVHMIITPSNRDNAYPLIHYIQKNNKWKLEGLYPEGAMTGARNYQLVDNNGTIVYCDFGTETVQPWPGGHLYLIKTNGEKLVITKVTQHKSFYHSVSAGDFNNDGFIDVIGSHMGSYNPWKGYGHESIHIYTQTSNGTFLENKNIMTLDESNYWTDFKGTGSVLSYNLVGDERHEIVRATYFTPQQYGIAIYKFSEQTKKYEIYDIPKEIGIFSQKVGATSMKPIDFDKDGDMDLAVAFEGYVGGVQLFINNNSKFTAGQRFEFTDIELQIREFEVGDYNSDGFQDIILHTFHEGRRWRVNWKPEDRRGEGIKLNNLIWVNNNGKFEFSIKDIIIMKIRPCDTKGFILNNKLIFNGLENMGTDFNGVKFYQFEILN